MSSAVAPTHTLPGLTRVSRQTLAVEGIGQRVAGCRAGGVAGPVQTLVYVPLTAQPHKAWRAGAVEASRFGGAGPMVVTGLGLTSVGFLRAVLSTVAWGTLRAKRIRQGTSYPAYPNTMGTQPQIICPALSTFQFKASFSSPSITALCSPTLQSQLHDTQSLSGVQPSPSSSPKASYGTLPLNNSSVFGKTSLSQPHLHQALSCFID